MLAAVVVARGAVARAAPVTIAIVAPDRCPPALRERIAEQLVGVADSVDWACLARMDEEEPFRREPGTGAGVRFWIDLTPGTEVRFTLRDAPSDRFVVRRIAMAGGLDEIAREEIGQVVRSALLAVRAGPEETLSRDQARAEVARWPQPPPEAEREGAARETSALPRPAGRPVEIEVGAFAAVRAVAPAVPLAGELGLELRVGRWRVLGGWVEAAYQWPVTYDATPLGVELSAATLHAGLDVSAQLGGWIDGRAGLGAGVSRTAFTPRAAPLAATGAPAGAFTELTGRLLVGLDARPARHLVVGLMAFLDADAAEVHYDDRDERGASRRVLTPRRWQPAVALRLAWSR